MTEITLYGGILAMTKDAKSEVNELGDRYVLHNPIGDETHESPHTLPVAPLREADGPVVGYVHSVVGKLEDDPIPPIPAAPFEELPPGPVAIINTYALRKLDFHLLEPVAPLEEVVCQVCAEKAAYECCACSKQFCPLHGLALSPDDGRAIKTIGGVLCLSCSLEGTKPGLRFIPRP